jgi:cell division septal protein FtsQ
MTRVRETPPRLRRSNPTRREVPERPPRPWRRSRRVTRWLLFGFVVVVAIVLTAQWVLRQPFLRVQHVTIVGAHHESPSQVLLASGLETHPAMLKVNSQVVEQRLRVFPWIDKVTLIKHWPNSIVLSVKEATAVAVAYKSAHEFDYVSASGRDLGPAPLRANLPTLKYLGATTTPWPYARSGRSGAEVASRLPRAFSAQVSVITVNAAGDVNLQLTTPVTFELGPATNLHDKFVAIASVIAHSTLAAGDVIDVTVPAELAVTSPG